MKIEETRWWLVSVAEVEGRLQVSTFRMRNAPDGYDVRMVVSVPLVPFGEHGEQLKKKRRFIVNGRNYSKIHFETILKEKLSM